MKSLAKAQRERFAETLVQISELITRVIEWFPKEVHSSTTCLNCDLNSALVVDLDALIGSEELIDDLVAICDICETEYRNLSSE